MTMRRVEPDILPGGLEATVTFQPIGTHGLAASLADIQASVA